MSNIIGIGGSIHDFASCLLIDKKMCAIEDERITRVRHAINSSNPCQPSLQYCLNWAGLQLEDIDTIIANDDLLQVIDSHVYPDIVLVNHHLTHAYSTFFISPFEEAAILVIDGAGSKLPGTDGDIRETTTYAYGNKNEVTVINRVYGDLKGENHVTKSETLMSNSIGEFYRAIAENLELGWLVGPGKVMGLASYGASFGDDRFISEMMSCIELLPEGQFKININGEKGLIDKFFQIRQNHHKKEDPFRIDAAIAHAGQVVLEKVLFHTLDYLSTKIQTKNLCLAGGVALNSLANGKIPFLTKFKNVHVFFAPGDSGTAIGAAIWGYLNNSSQTDDLIRFHSSPFLGRPYSLDEIVTALNSTGLTYTQPVDLCRQVAHLLSRGRTVAWYQGGSEFGPRALGNRSILADPRNSLMRDHINSNIKHREWFRPLAPAVLDSATAVYFDTHCPSPWMQFVWPVRKKFHKILPSIIHVDGGARVQSVSKDENPSFYTLLENFQQITGIPVLLNTSFNIKGEPIVETPYEAIRTFLESQIDVLVLGEFLVVKKANF